MFTENAIQQGTSAATSAQPARQSDAEKVPLAELAAEAVMQTDGDTARGAALLLRVLKRGHGQFYREKAGEVMLFWAQHQINTARTRLRSRIANAPRGGQSDPHQALSLDTLRAAAAAWFDWPVLPGVLLRDATRTELAAASSRYLRDASVFTCRGLWLGAVAQALPDDKVKVSEAMDEAAVGSMAARFGVSTQLGE